MAASCGGAASARGDGGVGRVRRAGVPTPGGGLHRGDGDQPGHAKALKGDKTDAEDAVRLLDLYECGCCALLLPAPDLEEVRDLTRYRMRRSRPAPREIQRLQKRWKRPDGAAGRVDVTGVSATAMIEALIDGERRGAVLADLAQGRCGPPGRWPTCRWPWPAGSPITSADVPAAPEPHRGPRRRGRWPGRQHRAAGGPPCPRGGLLKSLPGFGDAVVAGSLGAWPGPAPPSSPPPRARPSATVFPGNYMSAKKSKGGRTGDGGNYSSRCWSRPPGRRSGTRPLQARFTGWSAGSAAPGQGR